MKKSLEAIVNEVFEDLKQINDGYRKQERLLLVWLVLVVLNLFVTLLLFIKKFLL